MVGSFPSVSVNIFSIFFTLTFINWNLKQEYFQSLFNLLTSDVASLLNLFTLKNLILKTVNLKLFALFTYYIVTTYIIFFITFALKQTNHSFKMNEYQFLHVIKKFGIYFPFPRKIPYSMIFFGSSFWLLSWSIQPVFSEP